MKKLGLLCIIILSCWLVMAGSASAEERWHTVAWGENLTTIARRYSVSIQDIVAGNQLWNPNYIWVGQRLRIPSIEPPPTPIEPAVAVAAITVTAPITIETTVVETSAIETTTIEATTTTITVTVETPASAEPQEPEPLIHVVQPGDSLSRIATRYGTTVNALVAQNSIRNPNLLFPGQKLTIVASDAVTTAATANAAAPTLPTGTSPDGKWIEINLSTSIVTAWQGVTRVRDVVASLGLPGTPTPPGRYEIQTKYLAVPMSGPGYYLPNVPHTMFFYRGYAIHGAYWHNNFGYPMSHGCVNLSLPDAEWLYGWTPLHTPVIIHW